MFQSLNLGSLITIKWLLQRKENLIPLLNWLFQQVDTKWVSKIF
jgi:hypothetical protein